MVAERIFESSMRERPLSVLVVEGNPAARERVRQALGETYELCFVGGVTEALDAVCSGGFDLVVSEVDLPDGNGLRLCEQMRRQPGVEHLPILLLTSRSSIQDKVAGFQAGADDYVVKPLDLRLFHARVRLLYRIKGLERPRDIGA